MDQIDEMFEASKRNMPSCSLTAKTILERAESASPKKKRAWIPFVAVPTMAAIVCAIVLPLTLNKEPQDETIEVFQTPSNGSGGAIRGDQTWYVGLKTTSLPEKEKSVEVYYGFQQARFYADNKDDYSHVTDFDQEVVLSVHRDIYQKKQNGTTAETLISSSIIASFDSTLGEAMFSTEYACSPYHVDRNGNYTFGAYEKEPVIDLLTAATFEGSSDGYVRYSFGIEPKEDEYLHYREPGDSESDSFEHLGFYYGTSLNYSVDKEGKVSLSGTGYNHPIPGVQY